MSAYNSLVQEGPKVMLFYDGRSAGEVEAVTCVAISSDYGRTFHKPSLGLVSPPAAEPFARGPLYFPEARKVLGWPKRCKLAMHSCGNTAIKG